MKVREISPVDSLRRLIIGFALLVVAWPVADVASGHQWYTLLGLCVVARLVGTYLGASAAWRLWRRVDA